LRPRLNIPISPPILEEFLVNIPKKIDYNARNFRFMGLFHHEFDGVKIIFGARQLRQLSLL